MNMTHAETTPAGPNWRIDWLSAGMALVTSLALTSAVWHRFGSEIGSPSVSEPPAVGVAAPALRLLDLEASNPVPPGLAVPRGRVVWVTFWSADRTGGRADLAGLEAVWGRLNSRSRFAMAAAAVEADQPERVRARRGEGDTPGLPRPS